LLYKVIQNVDVSPNQDNGDLESIDYDLPPPTRLRETCLTLHRIDFKVIMFIQRLSQKTQIIYSLFQ